MARTEVEIIRDGKIVSQDFSSGCILTDAIGNLQVTTAKIADRSVTAQKLDASINFFPSGGIVMWNGSALNIPSGWALCDGTNGTPDLRDRFIVGAGRNYSPNAIGGADSVSLTQGQMPSHSHSGTTSSAGGHSHSVSSFINNAGEHGHSGTALENGWHTHTASSKAYIDSTKVFKYGGDAVGAHGYTNTDVAIGGAGAHIHSVTIYSGGNHSHTLSVSVDSVSDHTHTISAEGGGQPHENRPPFYALCFIMKT